jgi:hypothetical protein
MNQLYKTICTIVVMFCLVLQGFSAMFLVTGNTDTSSSASMSKSPAGIVSLAIPVDYQYDKANLAPQEEQADRTNMVFAELETVHSELADFLLESPGLSKFPPLLHSRYPSPLYTLHRPPNSAA